MTAKCSIGAIVLILAVAAAPAFGEAEGSSSSTSCACTMCCQGTQPVSKVRLAGSNATHDKLDWPPVRSFEVLRSCLFVCCFQLRSLLMSSPGAVRTHCADVTSTFVHRGIAWIHSALSCHCILLFQLPGCTYITGEHNCYAFHVAGMLAEKKSM